MNQSKWPKKIPDFTDEQIAIKNDFMHRWMDQFPDKYGAMEVFNQNYPAKAFKRDVSRKKHWTTLEIGGGAGKPCSF